MLIQFQVENHRSLCDEQILSMVAAGIGDKSDERLSRPEGLGGASESERTPVQSFRGPALLIVNKARRPQRLVRKPLHLADRVPRRHPALQRH